MYGADGSGPLILPLFLPAERFAGIDFFSGVIGVVPGLAKSAVPPRGTPANKKGTSEVDARRFRGPEPLSKQRSPPCILGIAVPPTPRPAAPYITASTCAFLSDFQRN